MNKKIIVEESQQGQRIDSYLAQQWDLSRSIIQKYITEGAITVNGAVVKKHYTVLHGDSIALEREEETVVLVPHTIPILYEDEQLLVIDKPIGVLVHPTETSREWTLVDFLKEHIPEITTVGDNPTMRPGIVHRLDRSVSGVMVIAKTPEAFASLKEQFQKRIVVKEYRAIVFGVPVDTVGVIRLKIDRSKTHGGKMAARPEHAEGKEAWTEYTVLRSIHDRFAELRVHIKTGRTHQIRAHLAAIDHPVVGDTLYQSKHYRSKKEYPRLLLHALQLTVTHPITQKSITWTAPLPKAFTTFSDS